MRGAKVDRLCEIWDAWASNKGVTDGPPFASRNDLYETIDNTKLGDAPWKSFSVSYTGPRPEAPKPTPGWMDKEYEVWYRDPKTVLENQLANPEFKNHIHYAPFREYGTDGQRHWQDLMSANWAWSQAVCYHPWHWLL